MWCIYIVSDRKQKTKPRVRKGRKEGGGWTTLEKMETTDHRPFHPFKVGHFCLLIKTSRQRAECDNHMDTKESENRQFLKILKNSAGAQTTPAMTHVQAVLYGRQAQHIKCSTLQFLSFKEKMWWPKWRDQTKQPCNLTKNGLAQVVSENWNCPHEDQDFWVSRVKHGIMMTGCYQSKPNGFAPQKQTLSISRSLHVCSTYQLAMT